MAGRTETIDCVVAAIGRVAITRSDVVHEYRMEQFLATGRPQVGLPSVSGLQQARTRLIDQRLLAEEIGSYPANDALLRAAALKQIAGLRARFKGAGEFHSALRSLGVTENQLAARLERDQRILLMISSRMRPAAVVSQSEIQDYYERTFLPKVSRLGQGAPPPLTAVEGQIREILVQENINRQLNQWVKELGARRRVRILSP
ncbi:MAG: hypothetical protein ACRD1J_01795 [Terriglobia bacterium]